MTEPGGAKRRWWFGAAAAALVLLAVEAFAFVAIWVRDGKPFSPVRTQRELGTIVERFDPDRPLDLADSPDAPHPYLGFIRNPDLQPTVSEFGYPDTTPLFTQRAEGRTVIAVVGGSVAFHFAKQGLPEVLERLRREPRYAGNEFVVANLAVGGYKQPQQLMTLSYLLTLGFEFDIVINVDGFNEVALYPAESASRQVFPIYPRTWYATMNLTPDPVLQRLQGRALFAEENVARAAREFSSSAWRLSPTATLIWKTGHVRRLRAHAAALEAVRGHEPEASPYSSTGPRVNFATESDLYDHLASIWSRSSMQLDQLCRANSIRYYHFLQPNQYVPGTKPLSAEERRDAYREDQPYRAGAEKGYPRLAREGQRLIDAGVRFSDLSGAFVGRTETLYIDDCCHYNELGNRLLAERVAQTLLAG